MPLETDGLVAMETKELLVLGGGVEEEGWDWGGDGSKQSDLLRQ